MGDTFSIFFYCLEDTLNIHIFFLQWTPPNVTVPILNLVDNIFQLKKRGWLRYVTLLKLSVIFMLFIARNNV